MDLLVEAPRPPAPPTLSDLAEPLRAIARRIDLLAGTGNGPTAVHRFEARHHPSHIAADGQITARQLLQGLYAVLPVIDQPKQIRPQPLGELPRIHAVTLVAGYQ